MHVLRRATQTGILLAVATTLLAGCPDKDKHESIELTNQGVEKFNNQSWDTAIQQFKDATHKWQGNHSAWYSMGEAYGKQDKWKDAAEAYQQAAKHKKDDAMYHMRVGQALYNAAVKAATNDSGEVKKLGNLSEAENALEKAVELNKDLFRAHFYLGEIYLESDRPKDAAESWTTAAMLNPTFGRPFIKLGELYLRWDMFDEAIRVLSQGAQHVLAPEELSDVQYWLGFGYDMKSRMSAAEEGTYLDKAIESYSKAIDARSDNYDAKLMRGLAYVRKGDKSKAEADLSQYVKRGVGNAFEKYEATKALYGIGGNPL